MSSFFLAVQFEFTHALGPHAGRYVVVNPDVAVDPDGAVPRASVDDLTRRDRLTGVTMSAATADVLAISIIGAPSGRKQRLRRRAREHAVDGEPGDVPVLLATYIRGTRPLAVKADADRELVAISADEDAQQEWVRQGLLVLNRAIRGYRHGSRDPYVTEVAQRDARAVRIGFGTTEGLPDGAFVRAAVLPPPLGYKPSREEKLIPAETTADVLAGRIQLLEGEDVLLRAFVDLDHGRPRAALMQVRAAVYLLEVELSAAQPGHELGVDLGALATRADELIAGLAGGAPSETAVDAIESMAGELEHALERWRYARSAPS